MIKQGDNSKKINSRYVRLMKLYKNSLFALLTYTQSLGFFSHKLLTQSVWKLIKQSRLDKFQRPLCCECCGVDVSPQVLES